MNNSRAISSPTHAARRGAGREHQSSPTKRPHSAKKPLLLGSTRKDRQAEQMRSSSPPRKGTEQEIGWQEEDDWGERDWAPAQKSASGSSMGGGRKMEGFGTGAQKRGFPKSVGRTGKLVLGATVCLLFVMTAGLSQLRSGRRGQRVRLRHMEEMDRQRAQDEWALSKRNMGETHDAVKHSFSEADLQVAYAAIQAGNVEDIATVSNSWDTAEASRHEPGGALGAAAEEVGGAGWQEVRSDSAVAAINGWGAARGSVDGLGGGGGGGSLSQQVGRPWDPVATGAAAQGNLRGDTAALVLGAVQPGGRGWVGDTVGASDAGAATTLGTGGDGWGVRPDPRGFDLQQLQQELQQQQGTGVLQEAAGQGGMGVGGAGQGTMPGWAGGAVTAEESTLRGGNGELGDGTDADRSGGSTMDGLAATGGGDLAQSAVRGAALGAAAAGTAAAAAAALGGLQQNAAGAVGGAVVGALQGDLNGQLNGLAVPQIPAAGGAATALGTRPVGGSLSTQQQGLASAGLAIGGTTHGADGAFSLGSLAGSFAQAQQTQQQQQLNQGLLPAGQGVLGGQQQGTALGGQALQGGQQGTAVRWQQQGGLDGQATRPAATAQLGATGSLLPAARLSAHQGGSFAGAQTLPTATTITPGAAATKDWRTRTNWHAVRDLSKRSTPAGTAAAAAAAAARPMALGLPRVAAGGLGAAPAIKSSLQGFTGSELASGTGLGSGSVQDGGVAGMNGGGGGGGSLTALSTGTAQASLSGAGAGGGGLGAASAVQSGLAGAGASSNVLGAGAAGLGLPNVAQGSASAQAGATTTAAVGSLIADAAQAGLGATMGSRLGAAGTAQAGFGGVAIDGQVVAGAAQTSGQAADASFGAGIGTVQTALAGSAAGGLGAAGQGGLGGAAVQGAGRLGAATAQAGLGSAPGSQGAASLSTNGGLQGIGSLDSGTVKAGLGSATGAQVTASLGTTSSGSSMAGDIASQAVTGAAQADLLGAGAVQPQAGAAAAAVGAAQLSTASTAEGTTVGSILGVGATMGAAGSTLAAGGGLEQAGGQSSTGQASAGLAGAAAAAAGTDEGLLVSGGANATNVIELGTVEALPATTEGQELSSTAAVSLASPLKAGINRTAQAANGSGSTTTATDSSLATWAAAAAQQQSTGEVVGDAGAAGAALPAAGEAAMQGAVPSAVVGAKGGAGSQQQPQVLPVGLTQQLAAASKGSASLAQQQQQQQASAQATVAAKAEQNFEAASGGNSMQQQGDAAGQAASEVQTAQGSMHAAGLGAGSQHGASVANSAAAVATSQASQSAGGAAASGGNDVTGGAGGEGAIAAAEWGSSASSDEAAAATGAAAAATGGASGQQDSVLGSQAGAAGAEAGAGASTMVGDGSAGSEDGAATAASGQGAGSSSQGAQEQQQEVNPATAAAQQAVPQGSSSSSSGDGGAGADPVGTASQEGVSAKGANTAQHAEQQGARQQGQAPSLPAGFDWQLYLKLNPDLAGANIVSKEGAEEHYLGWGAKEGRPYRQQDTGAAQASSASAALAAQ